MADKKKLGRPTEAPRVLRLEIRLSETDDALLNECVTLTGMTKTDILMKGLRIVLNEAKEKGVLS